MSENLPTIPVTQCRPQPAAGIWTEPTARCNKNPPFHWDELRAWEQLRHNSLKSLACARILQALQDIGGTGSGERHEKEYNRGTAERFLFSRKGTAQLEFFCDLADLHIDNVRAVALRVMKEGFIWRAPAGKGSRYLERRNYRLQKKSAVILSMQSAPTETRV